MMLSVGNRVHTPCAVYHLSVSYRTCFLVGDASQQSDPDSNAPDNIMGIVGEAVAFSAMQRGLTAHFGGGESRMTRRTTIVETDNMQFR
jgi:hypothetical protein